MDGGKAKGDDESILSDVRSLMRSVYIRYVPSYGNNFFFTIGVYLLELFVVLAITGIVMLVFGPYWWNLTTIGSFFRSVHLWAAEAFVTLMFVHLFVNFSTSAFKHKKLVWMIGSIMLLLVLLQFAFGVGIQGGLVSQWNDKAAADLWNGLGLGYWINPLNAGAVLGWHIAIVPLLLAVLMVSHFMLVKKKGISKPYRKDIPYRMVPANHKTMYKRMVYVAAVVLLFAVFLPAPYIAPLTIKQAASEQPDVVAATFLREFNFSSSTATYLDTIDPYTFSTRRVFVSLPYSTYINLTGRPNMEEEFMLEQASARNATMAQALSYFESNGSVAAGLNSTNPLIVMAAELTQMAKRGTYQDVLQGEVQSGLNNTYVILFLNDTGILTSTAHKYGLLVPQLGMLKVAGPPWSLQYWLLPYNVMEIFTGNIPWWNDLENGLVATFAFILLLAFPFIPYVNTLPDKLGLYKIFWNRFTVPEMRKRMRKRRGRFGG